jgi:hypothetical protein
MVGRWVGQDIRDIATTKIATKIVISFSFCQELVIIIRILQQEAQQTLHAGKLSPCHCY